MKRKIKFDEPRESVKVEVPSNGSGFFNGLVLGALAGAAGFFLYGTKKGELVKNKLNKEIKKAGKEIDEIKDRLQSGPKEEDKKPKVVKKTVKKPLKKLNTTVTKK